MRVLTVLIVLPMLLGVMASAPSAVAGGWAATVLDPVPERFEPGRSYTIGYWVLQHGSHPYDGDLTTGLRLEGTGGGKLEFAGVALPEPAHFAVAVSVPAKGEWTVYAEQGIFADHKVGTLTVPGGLKVRPVEVHSTHDGEESPWGAIHPPLHRGSQNGEHQHADHPMASDTRPTAALHVEDDTSITPTVLVASGLLLAAGLLVLVRRRRRTSA